MMKWFCLRVVDTCVVTPMPIQLVGTYFEAKLDPTSESINCCDFYCDR